MATILRVYNDLGVKYDLDVFNEQQFLLDISAIESGDIGKVFGISSQTFALPPTANNNEYFGNLFDLGATYPSGSLTQTSTAPTTFIKTMPCQVLTDGISIFTGKLYLDSVITDEDGDTIYNVNVVNETIDFKYQIQDLTFGDLDWSEYNHTYTLNNITSSWELNLFSGDVVYPLVEYGADKNDASAVEIKSGGGTNTFTNASTPLKVDDFKPAIRLSAIMDKVFDTLNYKYTSSLFESAYGDTIYMLSTKDTQKGTAFVNPIQQAFKAEVEVPFNASYTGSLISASNEIYDNAGNYNPSTYRFTAGETGQYSFDVSLEGLLTGISFPNLPRIALIEIWINGSPTSIPSVWYNLKGTPNNTTKTFNANFSNVQLNSSDYVEFYVYFQTEVGVAEFLTINPQSYIQCYQSPLTQVGANVNLKGIFEENISILQWLNGVIQKFNLVIEPLRDNPKVLSIEPFNTWVDNGSVVDWTNKVDRSVKWEIRHPMAKESRQVYFSDVEDKDSTNQWSIENLGKIFGDKTYTSDSDLSSGERRIGTFFAPTPMKYIEGTTDFIIPRIYTTKNGAKERFIFKPRLLHYLGLKNSTSLSGRDESGNTTQNEWYVADEAGTISTKTAYPAFHHVNQLPATPTAKDLHFSNPNHWEYHQSFVNARTANDAFSDYWAFYINELYDIDSRLLTLNIALKPTDIPSIALNDKIFIDGHYYRINKISGANLTKEQSTKVELIKSLPRKSKFPRRRIIDFEGGGGYTDVYIPDDNINTTGGVVYNDWNTDTPITSSVVVEQAGYRDGLFVYSGSVVLGTPKRPIEPNDNIVIGVNYIDERANGLIIQGSGNEIQGNVKDSIIVGSNNIVRDETRGSNIFGSNVNLAYNVDSVFIVNTTTGSLLVPTGSQNVIAFNPTEPITAQDNGRTIVGNIQTQGNHYEKYQTLSINPGDTIYLTGSSDINFHHHLQWVGANGTAIVFLPSASLAINDGRQMRYTTDGALGGSKTIYLTPSDGTIDGNPEKALNTPWDGLTAQVINGNWLVIQEKG